MRDKYPKFLIGKCKKGYLIHNAIFSVNLSVKSMCKALYTKAYIHHRVWCQCAILQKVKQQTERHGQRDFSWACIVQQMFQQLTSQQLALQALQQQHPGCQKQISQRHLEKLRKTGRLYHWSHH